MTTAADWLTDADLELLGAAYRGPWGPNHKTPERLVDSVNLIVATHLQAQRERIARAIEDYRDETTAGIANHSSEQRSYLRTAARIVREVTS